MVHDSQCRRERFPARVAALAELAGFVGRWAAQAGLAADEQARLRLVAEELFLNSVQHGYGGDCGAAVEVELARGDAGTLLVLEDGAPGFDPFAGGATPSASADAHARPVGGLGLPLVIELSAARRYQRLGERNRIELVLARR